MRTGIKIRVCYSVWIQSVVAAATEISADMPIGMKIGLALCGRL